MDITHDSLNDWIDRLHPLAPEAREAEFASLQEQGWDASRIEALRAALAERTILGDQISPGSADPSLPRSIGRYAIVDKISEGGMGIVLRAEQTSPIRRTVAIKVLKAGLDSASLLSRFEAEQQALALMEHPNIAKVYDAGMTDTGRAYFVMEYVPGEAITAFCDNQRLTIRQRLELYRDVGAAVQHAHMKGVIHRDLKPSNVLVSMVDGKPAVKVIDFGIAKAIHSRLGNQTMMTEHGQLLGTPEYMSPEQAAMDPGQIDTRTDVYGLGVMLYELLVGSLPFDAKSLRAVGIEAMREVIAREPAPRLSTKLTATGDGAMKVAAARQSTLVQLAGQLTGELDWMVLKALRKDRHERYQSAAEFGQDLENFLDGRPLLAGPLSQTYKLKKFVLRNKSTVAGSAIALVVTILGVAIAFWMIRQSEQKAISSLLAEQTAKQESIALAGQRETLLQNLTRQASDADADLGEMFFKEEKDREALVHFSRSLKARSNFRAKTESVSLLIRNGCRVPNLMLIHGEGLSTAMFSPDGTRLLSAGSDRTARIWDAVDGKPISEPMKHERAVESAIFSPDGSRVLTVSSDNIARLWDASTSKPMGNPIQHERPIRSAAFSADGTRIVTASWDNTARIWDAYGGKPIGEPMRHGDAVAAASFSPDGTRIVTASQDKTARIWDGRSGAAMGDPIPHDKEVYSADFSPDGTWVLTATRDTSQVWDSITCRAIGAAIRTGTESAKFCSDGKRIMGITDKGIEFWDASSGILLSQPEHGFEHIRLGFSRSVVFSADGLRLLRIGEDEIDVCDAITGRAIGTPILSTAQIQSASFSPDGLQVVCATLDGVVRTWPAMVPRQMAELMRHPGAITDANFSSDGSRLLTICADRRVRIWETASGKMLSATQEHHFDLKFAAFSPDSSRIVTAENGPSAWVWESVSGKQIGKGLLHGDKVNMAVFSPDGTRIVTAGRDKTAQVWDVISSNPKGERMRHEDDVHSAVFSRDGKRVVTASEDHSARIWDATSGTPLGPAMRSNEALGAAIFNPDSTRVLTVVRGGTLLGDNEDGRIWDALTGRQIGASLTQQRGIDSVEFSPDGTRVLTVNGDVAQTWDPTTGKPIGDSMKHSIGPVSNAIFSSDGTQITFAGYDSALTWDVGSGRFDGEKAWQVSPRDGQLQRRTTLSPDGRSVVTLGEDNSARLWKLGLTGRVAPPWLAKLDELVAGARLTNLNTIESLSTTEFARLRQQLVDVASSNDGDPDLQWLRWFLADPKTRTISPWSSVAMAQYINRRVAEDTIESLREAVTLDSNHPIALVRLGLRLASEPKEKSGPGWRIYSEFYTRRAVQLAPMNLEVVLNRKKVVDLLRQNPTTRAVAN